MFEKNNPTIALNIMFVSANEQEIKQAHISTKHNSKRKNRVLLLMITNSNNLALYTDHYQIMLTISLNFIIKDVHIEMMLKNVKNVKLSVRIVSVKILNM